jgi:hypothetical protein
MASYYLPSGKKSFLPLSLESRVFFPTFEKGGEGGLEIANKNKISPNPSLPKRGNQWAPSTFSTTLFIIEPT